MKTAAQWFELLPEFCGKNAIAYTRRDPTLKTQLFDTFEAALKAGFDWRATTEGWEFWTDIYNDSQKFIMTKKEEKSSLPQFWVGQDVLISKRESRFNWDQLEFRQDYDHTPWKVGEIRAITKDAFCIRVKTWCGKRDQWFLRNGEYQITPIEL